MPRLRAISIAGGEISKPSKVDRRFFLIDAQVFEKYLAFPKVFACGGSWMVTKELLAGKQFDKIADLSRDAVDRASRVTTKK